ncbi:hypothetical protein GW7_20059 [Heterocephalus glaber]|uniref:Uncharacterized protein n=1 Tax=Heterocephalus glaber TaxID=10181 RepID=G5B9M4_HETGA|nr:hypothetical protein GW7_20059 [Heterocephalus glaber]
MRSRGVGTKGLESQLRSYDFGWWSGVTISSASAKPGEDREDEGKASPVTPGDPPPGPAVHSADPARSAGQYAGGRCKQRLKSRTGVPAAQQPDPGGRAEGTAGRGRGQGDPSRAPLCGDSRTPRAFLALRSPLRREGRWALRSPVASRWRPP